MLKIIAWSVVAVAGIAIAAFLITGRERSWELVAGSPDRGPYDFGEQRRTATPRDALACSPGLCERPDFEIPEMDEAPPVAIERLAQRLLAIDPLARRIDDRSDPATARFVTYSPVMRFPDMIHLHAKSMPDGRTGIMAYARAQLGRKDFGKNRARLEALFASS